MHNTQEKILKILETRDLAGLSLREIGDLVGESGSAQKIKHHLEQLAVKGFVRIDKKNNKIEKIKSGLSQNSSLVSLPIMGSANCGEATIFADNHIEGYLKATKTVLGDLMDRVNNLFVLRAVGPSMNRADVGGNAIEDGDFVIVDKEQIIPHEGDYVVSVIDGVANIKKIYLDGKNQQIVLVSESNQDLPPIYIHRDDLDSYLIAGKVVRVMKKPDELEEFRNAAIADVVKNLEPLTDAEAEYYNNPDNFKKYA